MTTNKWLDAYNALPDECELRSPYSDEAREIIRHAIRMLCDHIKNNTYGGDDEQYDYMPANAALLLDLIHGNAGDAHIETLMTIEQNCKSPIGHEHYSAMALDCDESILPFMSDENDERYCVGCDHPNDKPLTLAQYNATIAKHYVPGTHESES